MVRKVRKPKSQADPQKVDMNGTPGNLPKKKPIRKKDETGIRDKVVLLEAKERVKVLKPVVDGIRARIMAERAESIHNPSVIQAEIDRARLNWEKAQLELSQAKGLSSKRKDEIDEWKAWYEKLSEADKPAGLERLQNEIKWRAAELDANGQKINDLTLAEFESRGVFEMAKVKLEAFHAGVHRRPLDQDPRLVSAMAELDKEVASVDRLTPGRTQHK